MSKKKTKKTAFEFNEETNQVIINMMEYVANFEERQKKEKEEEEDAPV